MDKINVSSQGVRIAQESSKAYGESAPHQCLGPRVPMLTLRFAGAKGRRLLIAAEPTPSYESI